MPPRNKDQLETAPKRSIGLGVFRRGGPTASRKLRLPLQEHRASLELSYGRREVLTLHYLRSALPADTEHGSDLGNSDEFGYGGFLEPAVQFLLGDQFDADDRVVDAGLLGRGGSNLPHPPAVSVPLHTQQPSTQEAGGCRDLHPSPERVNGALLGGEPCGRMSV
ncbi:hypothetical protein [Streptomyces wuyuanensis]|uniref:hypothetical protein n=1 Tax=Streptomyces wuyuanensis TaxID=1196353 RepID=UPI003699B5E6